LRATTLDIVASFAATAEARAAMASLGANDGVFAVLVSACHAAQTRFGLLLEAATEALAVFTLGAAGHTYAVTTQAPFVVFTDW